jgi:hypothetical protein
MEEQAGHYIGSAVEGKWWRRYLKAPFFAQGTGRYWYDEHAFYFHRSLTRDPLVIPFRSVRGIEVGYWHCGTWAWGAPIVKLVWEHDGHELSSGFVVARDNDQAQRVVEDLRQRVPASSP